MVLTMIFFTMSREQQNIEFIKLKISNVINPKFKNFETRESFKFWIQNSKISQKFQTRKGSIQKTLNFEKPKEREGN